MRAQVFLAKLCITTSYVFINTYLYSVWGSVKAATRKSPLLVGYRNQWIDAIMDGGKVEAVVTLGTAGAEAWGFWKTKTRGMASTVASVENNNAKEPESTSKNDETKDAIATDKV